MTATSVDVKTVTNFQYPATPPKSRKLTRDFSQYAATHGIRSAQDAALVYAALAAKAWKDGSDFVGFRMCRATELSGRVRGLTVDHIGVSKGEFSTQRTSRALALLDDSASISLDFSDGKRGFFLRDLETVNPRLAAKIALRRRIREKKEDHRISVELAKASTSSSDLRPTEEAPTPVPEPKPKPKPDTTSSRVNTPSNKIRWIVDRWNEVSRHKIASPLSPRITQMLGRWISQTEDHRTVFDDLMGRYKATKFLNGSGQWPAWYLSKVFRLQDEILRDKYGKDGKPQKSDYIGPPRPVFDEKEPEPKHTLPSKDLRRAGLPEHFRKMLERADSPNPGGKE